MTVLPGIMLMIIVGIGWAAVGAVVGAGANKKISWWVYFFQGKSCVGTAVRGAYAFALAGTVCFCP
ncbi:MAG: hypothetical protein IKD10_01290 [Lentisphaeria bacterium]|nr:hypothetical protein [Lentisphaeria bacterium]